jgi:hypothetical protein
VNEISLTKSYNTLQVVHYIQTWEANLLPPWGPWLVRRWWVEFVGTPPNETSGVVEVEVLAAGEHAGWAAYC